MSSIPSGPPRTQPAAASPQGAPSQVDQATQTPTASPSLSPARRHLADPHEGRLASRSNSERRSVVFAVAEQPQAAAPHDRTPSNQSSISLPGSIGSQRSHRSSRSIEDAGGGTHRASAEAGLGAPFMQLSTPRSRTSSVMSAASRRSVEDAGGGTSSQRVATPDQVVPLSAAQLKEAVSATFRQRGQVHALAQTAAWVMQSVVLAAMTAAGMEKTRASIAGSVAGSLTTIPMKEFVGEFYKMKPELGAAIETRDVTADPNSLVPLLSKAKEFLAHKKTMAGSLDMVTSVMGTMANTGWAALQPMTQSALESRGLSKEWARPVSLMVLAVAQRGTSAAMDTLSDTASTWVKGVLYPEPSLDRGHNDKYDLANAIGGSIARSLVNFGLTLPLGMPIALGLMATDENSFAKAAAGQALAWAGLMFWIHAKGMAADKVAEIKPEWKGHRTRADLHDTMELGSLGAGASVGASASASASSTSLPQIVVQQPVAGAASPAASSSTSATLQPLAADAARQRSLEPRARASSELRSARDAVDAVLDAQDAQSAEKSLDDARQGIGEARQALGELGGVIGAAQAALPPLVQRVSQLRAREAETTDQVGKLTARQQNLDTAIGEAQGKLEELDHRIGQTKKARAKAQEALDRLSQIADAELPQRRQELAQAQQPLIDRLGKIDARIAYLSAAPEGSAAELERTRAARERMAAMLQQALNGERPPFAEIQRSIARLETEQAALEGAGHAQALAAADQRLLQLATSRNSEASSLDRFRSERDRIVGHELPAARQANEQAHSDSTAASTHRSMQEDMINTLSQIHARLSEELWTLETTRLPRAEQHIRTLQAQPSSSTGTRGQT